MFSDDVTELTEDEYLIVEASKPAIGAHAEGYSRHSAAQNDLPGHTRFAGPPRDFPEGGNGRSLQTPERNKCVRFSPACHTEAQRAAAFDKVARSEKQTAVLLEYIQYSHTQPYVRRTDLTKRTGASDGVIKALVKKDIFEFYGPRDQPHRRG